MSKMLKDSLIQALAIVTGVATVFTILGFSMKDAVPLEEIKPYALTVIIRLLVLITTFALVCAIIFFVKRRKYKDSICLCISKNRKRRESDIGIYEDRIWYCGGEREYSSS